MSCSGKFVTHNVLRLLELFRIVPKGTHEVGEALRVAGDVLVRGGQTKVSRVAAVIEYVSEYIAQLFTPMYLVIARKP